MLIDGCKTFVRNVFKYLRLHGSTSNNTLIITWSTILIYASLGWLQKCRIYDKASKTQHLKESCVIGRQPRVRTFLRFKWWEYDLAILRDHNRSTSPSNVEKIREVVELDTGLKSREYGRRDPLRWPRGTLYPQKLALTSPTSGGRSVGILRSRTLATEFSLV
jgi:hypothetical protein